MSLLNPPGLLGLLVLPLIAGLHLYFARARREVVSSLYLWAFLDQKFHGSRPRVFKVTWLLVLDLLIAAVFSLAAARPQLVLPFSPDSNKQVIILLDTSSSMLAVDTSASRFAAAKAAVMSLLDSLVEDETAAVIASGSKAVLVGDTREIALDILKGRLEGLAAGGAGANIRQGLGLAEGIFGDAQQAEVHIFTDGAFDDPEITTYPYPITWHFFGQAGNNQAVTGVKLSASPDGGYQVFAELFNFSAEVRSRRVSVLVDGIEVSYEDLDMPPGARIPVSLRLRGDLQDVQVVLSDGDALPLDDSAGASRRDVLPLAVALVSEEPEIIARAILAVRDVDLTVLHPEDYSLAFRYDVTVFQGYLPVEWPAGSIIVFDPPEGIGLLWVAGMQTVAEPLTIGDSPVTDGLDFSGVRWDRAWRIQDWQDEFTSLISTQQKQPLLLEGHVEQDKIYVVLPVVSLGNFNQHPAFPILMSHLIESSREAELQQNYPLGDIVRLNLAELPGDATMTDPLGVERPIPGSGELVVSQIGLYRFDRQNFDGSWEANTFWVNGGDVLESNVRPQEWVSTIENSPTELESDITLVVDLTPWLLVIAGALLLEEAWRAWR